MITTKHSFCVFVGFSDTDVKAYAVHPGTVRIEIKRHMNLGLLITWKVVRPFTKTPVQGAQTTIYCAIQPELDEESGGYYRYSIRIKYITYSCRNLIKHTKYSHHNEYKIKFVLFTSFPISQCIKKLWTFNMHESS